jgi:hypothetical protein
MAIDTTYFNITKKQVVQTFKHTLKYNPIHQSRPLGKAAKAKQSNRTESLKSLKKLG